MSQEYPVKQQVATIISASQTVPLNEQELTSIVDLLQANGAIIEDVTWLRADVACDIYFAVLSIDDVKEMLSALLAPLPFDFIVQKTENRQKHLLISDMDSTMIQQECIDELADFAGLKDKISDITERAMNGELDFNEALTERVAMLKGLHEDVLVQAFNDKIDLMPGAKTLVATMKKHGAYCVLVSGGFTFFTQKVTEQVGFDVHEANQLLIEDQQLTGEVQHPILDKHAKVDALRYHSDMQSIAIDQTLAVGDGANDLPMLQTAGLGIAYHAKPSVRQQAAAKIDRCDLTALLYAQGYSYDQFVQL